MKQTKQKKIILIIVLMAFIVLLLNNNAVFAEINTGYSGTDSVTDENLDEAFNDTSLLNIIAKLIYAVGRFLEWILGTIFKLLTGSSDFPWADKIVFNAVPLLDVNFINPGGVVNGVDYTKMTFVGQNGIQNVLKNIYATILTLAASFLGIVVLITAIKLVVTTIASEKAKYKQAIIDWLVGFIMLFCIHYAISFIFYLNEQLVTVASKIVTQQLEDTNTKIASVQSDSLVQELIKNARASGATYKGELVADILERNKGTVSIWLNACKSNDASKGVQEALMKDVEWWSWGADVAIEKKTQYVNLGRIIWWAEQPNISIPDLTKIKAKAYAIERYDVLAEKQYGVECQSDCVGFIIKGNYDMYNKGEEVLNENGIYFENWEDMDVDEKYESFEAWACAEACVDEQKETYVATGIKTYDQALSTQDLKNIFKEQYEEFIIELKGIKSLEYMYYGTISSDGKYVIATQEPANQYAVKQGGVDPSVVSNNTFLLTAGIKKIFPNGHQPQTSDSVFYWSDFLNDLINLKKSSDTSSGQYVEGSGSAVRIISDLAGYFRYNSYSKELRATNVTGMKNGKNIYVQNMIMYSILVAQSLILFIAYVKRLFYVILLAMMAPIVVVFDFFQKFGK